MRLITSKHGAWFVLMVLGAIGISWPAHAAPVGTSITYQGQLKNAGGPTGGLHDLRFRLFDAVTLGAPVGSVICIDDVNVIAGLFTVSLDFGAQFAGQERYLEIEVRADTGLNCANSAGFATLTPRQALTAVPHALLALNATTATTATNATQLGGQAAAFYQNVTNQNTGTLDNLRLPVPLTLSGTSATHIIRGQNAAATDGAIGVFGATTAVSGQAYGGRFECASSFGRGVFGYAGAPTGSTYGVQGRSDSTSGYGVFGDATTLSGLNYGGWFQTASTSGVGVSGVASATSGFTYGGRFESASPLGRGVIGIGHTGVQGSSDSTTGTGIFAVNSAATGSTYALQAQAFSNAGIGVRGYASSSSGTTFGVNGQTNSSSEGAAGIYGKAAAISGITYGGRFDSDSTSGRAVSGYAGAATGPTYGVLGQSESSAGFGVAGFANATTGVTYGVRGQSNSQDGRGVYGVATSNVAGGSRYGVLGEAIPFAPPPFYRYGVYAVADLGASGYKTFRIDHPDDPENHYLLHYSTESPEAINFYRGTASLDGAGTAVVELPHYFAKINKTPSYMLTAMGGPMPMLHVAGEIDEAALTVGAKAAPGEAAPVCSFRVAGGTPSGKVSWRVEALRNDKWAQRSGAPVEIEKQGSEKGTYQHPDLYGQPPEKGMSYDAQRECSQSVGNDPVAADPSDATP